MLHYDSHISSCNICKRKEKMVFSSDTRIAFPKYLPNVRIIFTKHKIISGKSTPPTVPPGLPLTTWSGSSSLSHTHMLAPSITCGLPHNKERHAGQLPVLTYSVDSHSSNLCPKFHNIKRNIISYKSRSDKAFFFLTAGLYHP